MNSKKSCGCGSTKSKTNFEANSFKSNPYSTSYSTPYSNPYSTPLSKNNLYESLDFDFVKNKKKSKCTIL